MHDDERAFCAAVPNLRIMETDIDRLAWDDELVTHAPVFENGHLVMPDRPGWGTEPNEEAIRAHPPKGSRGCSTMAARRRASGRCDPGLAPHQSAAYAAYSSSREG